MRLSEWVKKPNGSISLLHERSGLAWTTCNAIVKGRAWPRPETAEKLSVATRGAVTVAEILSQYDGAVAQKHRERKASARAARKRTAKQRERRAS